MCMYIAVIHISYNILVLDFVTDEIIMKNAMPNSDFPKFIIWAEEAILNVDNMQMVISVSENTIVIKNLQKICIS